MVTAFSGSGSCCSSFELVGHEGQALLAAAGDGCDFIFGSSERELKLLHLR
jgi:hypothetical protein